MRPVYGRGDHFGVVTCKMDIWVRRNGQVLVRFWSPRQTLEQFSYEVQGLSLGFPPKGTVLLDEDCVPEIIRDAYDEWVRECLDYPCD